MSDCLIVGGGVVGLSLAYELASQGWKVRLLEAGRVGREASWAAAGIFPPVPPRSSDPMEQLTALSTELHWQWSKQLLDLTGIDNCLRRTGAVYLAADVAASRELDKAMTATSEQGIDVEQVAAEQLFKLEAALVPPCPSHAAYLLPDECQLRNPRHLQALAAGCRARAVTIVENAAALGFEISSGRVRGVQTREGIFAADVICVAGGAWSGELAEKLGLTLPIKPIRGQIVLMRAPRQLLSRIVNVGLNYLVPRDDGRVLVGSTLEDVGFDRNTTAQTISALLDFAMKLCPSLAEADVERTWAGLRPGSADGKPYLGRVPGYENLLVATGHYRSGVHLSTGTAVLMAQLLAGKKPQLDLSPFAVEREAVGYRP